MGARVKQPLAGWSVAVAHQLVAARLQLRAAVLAAVALRVDRTQVAVAVAAAMRAAQAVRVQRARAEQVTRVAPAG